MYLPPLSTGQPLDQGIYPGILVTARAARDHVTFALRASLSCTVHVVLQVFLSYWSMQARALAARVGSLAEVDLLCFLFRICVYFVLVAPF